MVFAYVIEHMEEDDEASKIIPPWVELEYAHMRKLAGPESYVHFTHLSKTSSKSLTTKFAELSSDGQAEAICHESGVLDLIKERLNGSLEKVCLLDPKAEKELSPEDGDGRFEWFLFGGILGDDPPRDRTAELRVMGFPTRHLGPTQMTTDTALGVTKHVVQDKEMPFKYIAKNGEPLLPPGMRELLFEDMNKGFEF
ncbi:SAM-dependent RNA methyltransferase [Lentinula aciculospora]|uniref:SAM-dependent RNA methyltransferase n=1 Tax=Lentinula aciculospora TaxID=153920 RepID=A0A9W9DX43_9AGAR|nr:SAM-dependent RNA methyltransferase [Lentinula aciculospora]